MKVPAMASVAVLLMTTTPAAADSCDAVTAALLKGLRMPWHLTATLKIIGKETQTYEAINTADKMFQREDKGPWKEKLRHLALDEAKIRRDWANSASCHDGGRETLGSESTVVVWHRQDTRFWISETSGLILKSETINRPAALTNEYAYANITAPL
jgi:hypothetical protein